MTKKTLNSIIEIILLVIAALVITFLVKAFIAQAFKVEMSSMVPTIAPGERIFAERISYRFRNPNRKEIVVFEAPKEVEPGPTNSPLAILTGQQKTLIKRVIGLPGDKVQIKNGSTYINDKKLSEPYKVADDGDFGPITVPAGKIFVMGDNRPFSRDSRNFGSVPIKSIAGRAIFSYWPITKIRLLTNT